MVWLISRVSEVEKSHVFKSFMPNHKGGGVVKQTSQRSLLFRQNVNRTEAEWVHFLDGYRQALIEFDMKRTGVDALCHSSSFQ